MTMAAPVTKLQDLQCVAQSMKERTLCTIQELSSLLGRMTQVSKIDWQLHPYTTLQGIATATYQISSQIQSPGRQKHVMHPDLGSPSQSTVVDISKADARKQHFDNICTTSQFRQMHPVSVWEQCVKARGLGDIGVKTSNRLISSCYELKRLTWPFNRT